MSNIKTLRQRLAELREERETIADTRRSPLIDNTGGSKTKYRHRSVIESTAEQIEKLDSLIAATEKEIDETRREILERVAQQETPALRVLYFYRLYEGLKWEQIAAKTGEEADALRVRFRRNEERNKSELESN